MTSQNSCPQCGTALPADSLGGLCPTCLLRNGIGKTASSPQSGSHQWQPPECARIGELFPEFDCIEMLGRGGMGAVYKVRQKALDRVVALKILPETLAEAAGFSERFTREAQAMAKLNHPNIVTLYEFGQRDGVYFLLMEFVDGTSLRRLIDTAAVSPREALALVPQICDALQFAHDRSVVHRDIKPENILIDRQGKVKIADFGLARVAAPGTGPATQVVMGTPYYMAPEQMTRPQAVDHRADIYSLGVVFYQLLTGELPIGRFEPPSHRVMVDVRLDEVVLRSLEREPERRYQQVSEMGSKVQEVAAEPLPGQQPGVVLGIVLAGRKNGQVKLRPFGLLRLLFTVLTAYAVAFGVINIFVDVPDAPFALANLVLLTMGFLLRALLTRPDRLINLEAQPPLYPRQTLLTGWRALFGIARFRKQDRSIDWGRSILVLALCFGFLFLYVAAAQMVFGIGSNLPQPVGGLATAFGMVAFMPLGYVLATKLWRLEMKPADNRTSPMAA